MHGTGLHQDSGGARIWHLGAKPLPYLPVPYSPLQSFPPPSFLLPSRTLPCHPLPLTLPCLLTLSFRIQLRGLGECCKLPQRVRAKSGRQTRFLCPGSLIADIFSDRFGRFLPMKLQSLCCVYAYLSVMLRKLLSLRPWPRPRPIHARSRPKPHRNVPHGSSQDKIVYIIII